MEVEREHVWKAVAGSGRSFFVTIEGGRFRG